MGDQFVPSLKLHYLLKFSKIRDKSRIEPDLIND